MANDKQESFLSKVARAARGYFVPSHTTESDMRAIRADRLAQYRENWLSYRGEDVKGRTSEDGRKDKPVNLLKKNIDKVNYFAFGKGFDLINDDYTEHIKKAAAAWGTRLIEDMLRLGQFGSVTGDAYIMVVPTSMKNSLVSFNEQKARFIAEVDAKISVVMLDPKLVTPIYDDFDMNRLLGVSIDIPSKKFVSNGTWQTEYHHMTITDESIFVETRDLNGVSVEGTTETMENKIGAVYVHHIRNYPDGSELYGLGDVADVAPLNSELSKEINSVGQILDYSGDPITLIFGARAKNLTKGKNKIWGGLPKDAKVENLNLDTDLTAATNNIEKITETLHSLMGVPEIAMGTKQAISNTSGVALGTMYMPLLERADTKQSIYGPHLIEVFISILRWIEHLNLEIDGVETDKRSKKLTESDYAKIRNDTIIKFPSVLPKDRLIEAQIQTTLMGASLQDREGALIAMGVPNPSDKIKAIDKDYKAREKLGMNNAPKNTSLESGLSPDQGLPNKESDAQKGAPRK